MTLTKEEYLAMVTQLVDQQYGSKIDYEPKEQPTLLDLPKSKDRVTPNANIIIDATKYKKEEVKEALLRAANLRVDNFLIKVIKHNYNPEDEDGMPMTYDVNIYEETPCIHLNRPSKKVTKLVPIKDSRLDTRPWASYFGASDRAYGMTLDGMLDMIRWLQAMGKMSAFL